MGLLLAGILLTSHVLADEDPLEKQFMTAFAADRAGDCDTAFPLYISLSNEGVPGTMINLDI